MCIDINANQYRCQLILMCIDINVVRPRVVYVALGQFRAISAAIIGLRVVSVALRRPVTISVTLVSNLIQEYDVFARGEGCPGQQVQGSRQMQYQCNQPSPD